MYHTVLVSTVPGPWSLVPGTVHKILSTDGICPFLSGSYSSMTVL
jgi:hypothetical protein